MSGADATTRFVVELDSGPLSKGARTGITALERMKQSIKSQQTALDGLRASMKRLQGSAAVIRYEAIPKGLQRAQSEVEKLGSKLEALKAKRGVNEAKGMSDIGLHKQIQSVEAQRGGAMGKVKQLTGEQANLGQDPTVKAFMDQKARAQELEGGLAKLQTQYSALGGDATEAASSLSAPKSALESLLGAAKEAGGPIGELAGKLDKIKNVIGKAGGLGLALVAVAIAVVVVAAIAGAVALTRFALGAADAARSSRILRQAAAGGSIAGLKELDGAISKIRANTAATRDEATQLATELYRAGMRGKGLEDAAITIERFGVLGEETKSQVRALYEQLQKPVPMGWRGFTVTPDMLPRDQMMELARTLGKDANKALMYGFSVKDRSQVADALKRIGKVRFGDSAIQQMKSLTKIGDRLKENLDDLFEGIDLSYFLGALHEGIMLFDKTTESGKALRKVAEIMFQPLFDKSSVLLPLIQGFFEGVIISVLQLTLWSLKARNAFNRMFPGSIFKGFDALSAGSLLGAIAVGTLVMGLGLCALALVLVAVAILTVIAVIALPFIIGAAAVYGLVKAFEAVLEKLGLISKKADSAGGSIRGLAAALPGSTVGAGNAAGAALGSGVVAGIQGKLADVTKAGAALVAAADKGVTTKAEIHSPSGLMRRRAGQMGEGAELGFDDKAADIEKAGEALVPSGHGGAGGRGAPGGGLRVDSVTIKIDAPNLRDPKDLMDDSLFARMATRFLAALAKADGGPEPEPAT